MGLRIVVHALAAFQGRDSRARCCWDIGLRGTAVRHKDRCSLMHQWIVAGWTLNDPATAEIDLPVPMSSRTSFV